MASVSYQTSAYDDLIKQGYSPSLAKIKSAYQASNNDYLTQGYSPTLSKVKSLNNVNQYFNDGNGASSEVQSEIVKPTPIITPTTTSTSAYTPPDYTGQARNIFDPLRQRAKTQYEGGIGAIRAAYDKAIQGYNSQTPLIEQQTSDALNQNDASYFNGKQDLNAAMEAAGQRGGENISGMVALGAMRGNGVNQINQIKANNLRAIDEAVRQAQADQATQESGLTTQYQGDMSTLDSEQAKAIQDAQQTGIVNAQNLAQILGAYIDPTTGIKAPTLALQQFDYGKTQDAKANSREDAKLIGIYNGNKTLEATQIDLDNQYRQGVFDWQKQTDTWDQAFKSGQFDYQKARDSVADKQWGKEYQLKLDDFAWSKSDKNPAVKAQILGNSYQELQNDIAKLEKDNLPEKQKAELDQIKAQTKAALDNSSAKVAAAQIANIRADTARINAEAKAATSTANTQAESDKAKADALNKSVKSYTDYINKYYSSTSDDGTTTKTTPDINGIKTYLENLQYNGVSTDILAEIAKRYGIIVQ